jgi:nucleoside 2-deoxyribosyltransferase
MTKSKLIIYYAGSIRGSQNNKITRINRQIINHLKKTCIVLTEHLSDESILGLGEELSDTEIYKRDIKWLDKADVLIAEVTLPSLGAGYEIRYTAEHRKKVLCLFNPKIAKKKLSAMISGCPDITVRNYDSLENVKSIIDEFLK